MKRIFIVLYAVVLWSFSQNAFGYKFTEDFEQGFYWASFPISIAKFATNSADADDLEYFVDLAEQVWENAIGRDIWGVQEGVAITPVVIGNNIRWSDNFAQETGFDPLRTLAVTIRYRQGTHVVKTEIILNGNLPDLRQNANNKLQNTIIHEMGHTIGLDHSEHYAIMSAYINNLSELQQDDVDGAQAVIEEALYRQETGFVSALAEGDGDDVFGACGTVDLGGKSGPGNGQFLFVFSLVLGIAISMGLGKLSDRLMPVYS